MKRAYYFDDDDVDDEPHSVSFGWSGTTNKRVAIENQQTGSHRYLQQQQHQRQRKPPPSYPPWIVFENDDDGRGRTSDIDNHHRYEPYFIYHGAKLTDTDRRKVVHVQIAKNVTELKSDCTFRYGTDIYNYGHGLSGHGGIFENCKLLIEIEFPSPDSWLSSTSSSSWSAIQQIDHHTFAGCTALKTIKYLPSTITSIKESAFEGCKALTKIILPESLDVIEDNAFANCESLQEIIFSIPKLSLSSLTPTSYDSSYVSSFNMQIGSGVFMGCKKLETMHLPFYVTEIGCSAFKNCKSLTKVIIPRSMKKKCILSSSIFEGCSNLSTIKIPNNTNLINNDNNNNNTSNNNNNENENNGIDYYFDPGEEDDNDGYGEIQTKAFYECTNLTSIIIPNSINKLGSKTFYNCKNLQRIRISKSIQRIECSTFENCVSLNEVNFWSSSSTLQEIGSYAFTNCISLQTIAIPCTVRIIEKNAFESCTNLVSISFSTKSATSKSTKKSKPLSMLEEIQSNCFSKCYKLKFISLPDSIYLLGDEIFSNCTSLEEVTIPSSTNKDRNRGNGTRSDGNRGSNHHQTNQGLIELPKRTFYGCTSLRYVYVSNTIQIFAKDCFHGCNKLQGITFISSSSLLSNDLTSDDDYFDEDGNPERILPSSLEVVGAGAFRGCSSLKDMVLPRTVRIIERDAFFACDGLRSIKFSEDDDIDNATSKINQYNVSTSLLKEIHSYAFTKCSNLKSIIIPWSVSLLGTNIFRHCISLEYVKFLVPIYPVTLENFQNGYDDKYHNNERRLRDIPNNTFFGCTSLRYINIPDTVHRIGKSCFDGCTSLEDIRFPIREELKHIGANAFYGTNQNLLQSLPNYVIQLQEEEREEETYGPPLSPSSKISSTIEDENCTVFSDYV